MSLIRWDPFGDVDTFFPRLLPNTFANWPRLAGEGNGKKLDWAPSADISETVKGERKQQKADKNEKFHRVESFYGSFERRFSLPDNVDADAITCESKDGILTVHIPKSEVSKQKPRQITVQ